MDRHPLTSWTDETGDLWARIPVARLAEHCNPFTNPPWDNSPPFTTDDVLATLNAGQAISPPHDGRRAPFDPGYHLGRIAWFVAYPDEIIARGTTAGNDPMLDVWEGQPWWMIVDGNHRFAAAMTVGLRTMPFVISGDLDLAEALFGIRIDPTMFREAS